MKKITFICLIVLTLTVNLSFGFGKIFFPQPKEIAPTKITGSPGLWRVYSTTNTHGFGVIGPDTATTDIYLKPTEEVPNAGDNYIRLGTSYTQTVDGVTSTIIPFTYEALPTGGSSISVNGSEVTDPNLISSDEINILNNSGQVSCVVNSITLSKLSSSSVITKAEYEADETMVFDDSTILTAAATYSLLSKLLGWPKLTITVPTNDSWITSNIIQFSGTSTDDGTVSLIEWKLESDGTYAPATGTSNWSQSGPWGSDGINKTAYFRATDNDGNTTVKSVRFNLDTVDPVIVAGADSTHDGVNTIIGSCTLNELNRLTEAVTFTAVNTSPSSGVCTGTYPNYTTPSLTPTANSDIVITYAAADLSGRSATGTDLIQNFTYSGGGGGEIQTISLLQHNQKLLSTSNSSITSTAFSSNITQGNTIVGVIWWKTSANISNITDNLGNSYTVRTERGGIANTTTCTVFHAPITNAGADLTVTAALTASSSYTFMWVGEFSNIDLVSPVDCISVAGPATTSPITVPTMTPSMNGEMFIQVMAQTTAAASTVDGVNGFTDLTTAQYSGIAYMVQPVAADVSAGISTTTTGVWTTIAASFKPKVL